MCKICECAAYLFLLLFLPLFFTGIKSPDISKTKLVYFLRKNLVPKPCYNQPQGAVDAKMHYANLCPKCFSLFFTVCYTEVVQSLTCNILNYRVQIIE